MLQYYSMALRYYILTGLLFLAASAFSQKEQQKPLRIEGRIIDTHLQPVSFAHILNKERNTGTISDYYGDFSLGSYPGDTLTISSISYHTLVYCVPDTLTEGPLRLLLVMETDTVFLQEQVIYPWPETYDELKKEILALEAENTHLEPDLHLPSLKDVAALARTSMAPGQLGLYKGSGPISLLYDKYSKEAKEKRELTRIRKYEHLKTRYNTTVVSIVTGLTDLEEINRLIEYCDLNTEFISNSTDYELYTAINQCYIEYSKLK